MKRRIWMHLAGRAMRGLRMFKKKGQNIYVQMGVQVSSWTSPAFLDSGSSKMQSDKTWRATSAEIIQNAVRQILAWRFIMG